MQLSDVSKRYDSEGPAAVNRVSLSLAPGESVAVMGPSGSGKSTLLNLVAGLDRPSSGTVTVAGERIDTLSETGLARFRGRRIGMIFQFFNLLDDRRAGRRRYRRHRRCAPSERPGAGARPAQPPASSIASWCHWSAVSRAAQASGDTPTRGRTPRMRPPTPAPGGRPRAAGSRTTSRITSRTM